MSFKDITDKWKRSPTDVTGIDFGQSATKIVRLQKNGDAITFAGAEILPAEGGELEIPHRLTARHVSICLSGVSATTKLLTLPGTIDAAFETNLPKHLGVDPQADNRISYTVITEGSGRAESRVLAISLPEADARPAMQRFASGLPAPYSLEISAIASLTTFQAGPVLNSAETAAALLDFGMQTTTLSIFAKKALVLVRRFDFGIQKLLDRVVSALHIDAATALNILSDNAFDISELITEIMGPFSSQVIVSRDFVERRENCSLKTLHCIGGIGTAPAAIQELERVLSLSVEMFDPFSIPVLKTAKPEASLDTQRWRLTAAIGAALGTLQEAS